MARTCSGFWRMGLRVKRGHNRQSATGPRMRLEHRIWRRQGGVKAKLAYLLFSWPNSFSGRLDWQIPRECLLEMGTLTRCKCGWRKAGGDLLDLLETAAWEKRRP